MAVSTEAILGWSRIGVFLLCMGIAAWMDHKTRRVANEHWLIWVKPAIFLWFLELIAREADWTIFLTASAVICYASTAIIGRPTLKDIAAGSRMDIIVTLWYGVSIFGLISGFMSYGDTNPLDVALGQVGGLAALWWSTVLGLAVIFVIDLAWRLRMIHGGADAKALMWVAILMPSWSTIPNFYQASEEVSISLPPAIALLMWGGVSFLLIPILLCCKNLLDKNVKSIGDLRMFWHSTMMDLEEVQKKHVWLLTTVIEMPDGSSKIHHRSRAPRRTPTDEQLAEAIENLRTHEVSRVWVSYKLPLLVFLFPAIIPMIIFGDLTTLVMEVLGL